MKQLSTLQKRMLLLFAMLICIGMQLKAQYKVEGGPVGGSCGDIYYRLTTTGSDCGKHGKIQVDLWGPAIDGVGGGSPTFTDVKYRCFITGSDSTNVEFFNQNVMDNLAPGRYTVEIEGKCAESAGSLVPKRLGVFVQIDQLGGWAPMDMQAQMRIQPLGCLANGTVRLHGIRGGLPPYKIEITEAPAGYTKGVKYSGSTLPTNGEFVIDDLITGTYKVVFSETSNCNEQISLTFTMGSTDGLPQHTSIFYLSYIYPSENYTGTGVDHCNSVLIRRQSSFTNDDQLKYRDYVQNWQNYFEYAVFYKEDDISNPASLTWNSFPSTNYLRLENIRYSISEIKNNAAALGYGNVPDKMPRVLVRVKGCTEVKEYNFTTNKPYMSTSTYPQYKDCGQAFLALSMYTDYDGVLCYPYTWKLVKTRNANGVIIPEEVYFSGSLGYGQSSPVMGPVPPGTYEYRCTDSGGANAYSWVANTFKIADGNTAAGSVSSTYATRKCMETYIPVMYFYGNNTYNLSELSKIEYVRTEKSTDNGSNWTVDPTFPAPRHTVIDVENDIPQSAKNTYPKALSPWAVDYQYMPVYNIGYNGSSTSSVQYIYDHADVINLGKEQAGYRHIFNVTDTCNRAVSKEITLFSPTNYYEHNEEPNFVIERGCLSGIKIEVPNINSLIKSYYRRTTILTSDNVTAYVWVEKKGHPNATVTYNNTSYSYITSPSQWIEVDSIGTYTIGVSIHSSAKSYPDIYCTEYYDIEIKKAPTFELDDINTAMYRCPGNQPGQGYIEIKVKNGMGPFRFELYDEGMNLLASNTDGLFENGAWSSTIASDKYIIKSYDEGCLPERIVSFEQGIRVYDLSNETTAWIRNPNVCESDSIVLQALALGTTSYDWEFYDENWVKQGEYGGRRLVIKDATLAMSGHYVSIVSVPGCNGAIVKDTVNVSVGEKLMYWKTDAEDSNWFNTNNWLKVVNGQLEPVKTVPAPCSTVHIPGNAINYPDLSLWDASFGQAACDSIIYHYGAETSYPNYLTYNRAVIQYNTGYYPPRKPAFGSQPSLNADTNYPGNTTTPTKMERARWYMLSTPLKQIVGGDFGLAGYPKMYQRLFNTTRTEAGKPMQDGFSKTFNHYTIPTLETGNALALWISDYDDYLGSRDQKYLDNLKGIIELPYIYDEGVIKENRPLHKFEINGTDSISYFYYFNANLEPVMGQFDMMKRGYQSYRFIFEDANNEKVNEWVDSEYVTLYRLPLQASYDGTGRIMIGNPFMSSINFDKFYSLNSSVIKGHYQVVTQNGEIVEYATGSPLNNSSKLDKDIPPLQSFIIERQNPTSTESIVFHMNGLSSVMSVAALNNPLPKPKNAEATEAIDGYITVQTVARGASQTGTDYSSKAGVMFNYLSLSNIGKSIFNEYPANRADVFFTDDDNYLYSQLVKNDNSKPATLYAGMFSQFTGEINMTIAYNGSIIKSVKFTDTYKGTTQDSVANGWSYTFNQNIKTENGMYGLDTKRFKFEVEYYSEATGGINTDNVKLDVVYFNRLLSVESSSSISYIKLTTLAGLTVFGENPSNQYSYKKEISVAPGAYIVQVVLESGETRTSKIIVQ